MCYLCNRKKKQFICIPCQGLYLTVPTPKEEVLLKLCVLKREWHSATIKLLHSRNILILGNSKRAVNMSTIELKLKFARQQFAEARIKVIDLLATITTPALYLSVKVRLTKNYYMIIVDSLGFYYRSHNGLKKHKQ